MHIASARLAGLGFAAALVLAACGGPPKQAEVPDVTEDTGADMSGGEDVRNGGTVAEGEETPAEDMHAKCCDTCKEALAKDRTGAEASTIPCTDFTDALSPWCLEHFRSQPTMASECK